MMARMNLEDETALSAGQAALSEIEAAAADPAPGRPLDPPIRVA